MLGWLGEREAARSMRTCNRVGPNLRLRAPPVIRNDGRLEIGAGFQLSSAPVQSHLAIWLSGALQIGDDVAIGHGAAIACQSQIRIGSGCRFAPFLVLADSDFHVAGDRNATPAPRPIEIGNNVRVGARVTILPGTTIGDGATVVAGSTVAGLVRARSTVAGVPARDVRLADLSLEGGTLDERLRSLVARVLGLAKLPRLTDGPAQLAEWDSLGALRILLAVEDELDVRLADGDLERLTSVAALLEQVEAKRAGR